MTNCGYQVEIRGEDRRGSYYGRRLSPGHVEQCHEIVFNQKIIMIPKEQRWPAKSAS